MVEVWFCILSPYFASEFDTFSSLAASVCEQISSPTSINSIACAFKVKCQSQPFLNLEILVRPRSCEAGAISR